MKFNRILLALIFLIIGNTSYALNQKPVRVTVEWLPLYMETVVDVNCDMFVTFKEDKQVRSFEDDLSMKRFGQLLKSFKKERKIESIDVRGRIVVYYYHQLTVKCCFDRYGRFYKDGIIYSNKRLFNFILDRLDSHMDRWKLE